jgi:hypothetical protein
MKRRIYKLKSEFTILGLGVTDWAILFGTFIFTINFFRPLGGRMSLVLCLVCTAAVYLGWNLIKDNVPDKFMNHLVKWLSEPEVYKVVPDTKNVPLVINLDNLQQTAKPKRFNARRRGLWL